MNQQLATESAPPDQGSPAKGRNWQNALPWALLGILLIAYIWYQAPALSKSYWEYDEGLNVIKAQLVRQGYWPHRDIWSDQPPLFTLLLSAVQLTLGPSLVVGRALVLAFAALLLVAIFWVTAQIAGRWAGLAAALLVALSPITQELSRTILIGLPAVTMGTFALGWALHSVRQSQSRDLAMAGLLFGLGMLIKPLIAPYYAPLIVLTLWPADAEITTGGMPAQSRWRRLCAFHAPLVLLLTLVSLLCGPRAFFGQVVGTLAGAREAYGVSLAGNASNLAAYLEQGYMRGVIVGALVTISMLVKSDLRSAAWTGIWLLASTLAVLLHTPQRWHEFLLVVPPLCALAAVPPIVAHRWRPKRSGVAAVFWVAEAVAIVLLVAGIPATLRTVAETRAKPLREGRQAADLDLALSLLRERVPTGSLIVTDDPMLAYLTGHTVPPQLAVPSLRRISSGSITSLELIQLCEQQPVGAVLFWVERFDKLPEFAKWARTHLALEAARRVGRFYTPVKTVWPQQACSSVAGLCLLGSAASTLSVDAGSELELAVYWQATRDIDRRYTLFAQLLSHDGLRFGQVDTEPFEHTDKWRAGDVVVTRVSVPVDASAPVGPLQISVGWYDTEGRRQAFVGADGQPLAGGQITLTPRAAVRAPSLNVVPSPDVEADATFDGLARLLGYDLTSTTSADGRSLTVALHWQALGETLMSYKVFVHVVGPDGAILAQSDQEPSGGRQPTTGWRSGDIVVDEHQIPLPNRRLAGPLQVYVGLYNPTTGERLPATAADDLQPDGRIPLASLSGDTLP